MRFHSSTYGPWCLSRLRQFFLIIGIVATALFLFFHAPFSHPRPDTAGVQRWLAPRQSVHEPGLLKAENKQQAKQVCVHPALSPTQPSVMEFYKKEDPVVCDSSVEDWVYVTNGTFRISRKAILQFGEITCDYLPLIRRTDFSVTYGARMSAMQDGRPITGDFFQVTCSSSSGKTYSKIHSAVARNSAVHERLRDHAARDRNKAPSSAQGLNLSVFMLGFDSMSRMAWLRLLPRTRQYFVQDLGGLELESYNILGDGTPSALLPILTGKMEEELPEARRGFKGATTVDGHPWIWKDFSRRGYVTGWAEDMASVGTFQYRMLGFKDEPTDHHMRPFYMAAEKVYSRYRPYCFGSTPRHVNFMRWFGDLFDMYREFPKFFFGFHAEMSHDNNNLVQGLDEYLKSFLQGLENSGHLNSTLLILMSDHGARFGFIRATAQGKLEERMPYFSFRFPPWFHRQYPNIIRNMKINVNRLTTPFDIHATLIDVLNYTGSGVADIRNRGLSLFKEIPKQRSCLDAEITPHWCACLDWQDISQSNARVIEAAQAALTAINQYTETQRQKCAELTLSNITQSARYICSAQDELAQEKIFKYWKQYRKNEFGRFDGIACTEGTEYYQVSFSTRPGDGHFEVMCYRDSTSGLFKVSEKEISRINKYGSQPACVQDSMPHLRPYCYCL